MKKAVMYGSGKIGRGFLGKVFADSGYEVTFLDIVPEITDAINDRGEYEVRFVSNDGFRSEKVTAKRAFNANTKEAVNAVAEADIMATAVGVNNLKDISKNIAESLKIRRNLNTAPLNIILAENQINSDQIMRGYIYEHLTVDEQKWADDNLGVIQASIGRTVPKVSKEDSGGDPLLIITEEDSELPVDKEAFKGEIPDLVGLIPFSPISFYMKRKLFMHNMAHAMTAYLGALEGIVPLAEAVSVPQIEDKARKAAKKVGAGLTKEYGVPEKESDDFIDDIIYRFKNRALKETVKRVAADPIRKLRRDDRLVGAALYTLENGDTPDELVEVIIAALKYSDPEDEYAVKLQKELEQYGIEYILENRLNLKKDEPLYDLILTKYDKSFV